MLPEGAAEFYVHNRHNKGYIITKKIQKYKPLVVLHDSNVYPKLAWRTLQDLEVER